MEIKLLKIEYPLELSKKEEKSSMYKKCLAFAVILLFISISFQPVIAKDTISPMKKSDTKELLETIKDLANNKEIQDIIQKSEIKGNAVNNG